MFIRHSTAADAVPSFIIEALEPRMVLSAATALEPMAPPETRSLTFDAAPAPVAAPAASGWQVSARETAQSQSGGPAADAPDSPLDDLDTTLTELLNAWKSGPYAGTPELADVIQAVRTIDNMRSAGEEAANPGLFDAIHQVVDALDDKLSQVTDVAGKVKEARDLLDSIDPLTEGKTMEDVRKVFGALGQASDEVSSVLDQFGAKDLATANKVLAALEPFTQAGLTLSPADTARTLADIIRGGNALNPIPGVSDMLDTYATAIDNIATTIQQIDDAGGWANLVTYAPNANNYGHVGSINTNVTLGHAWAVNQIMGDDKYKPYIPADYPLTDWPNGVIPDGVYPVR